MSIPANLVIWPAASAPVLSAGPATSGSLIPAGAPAANGELTVPRPANVRNGGLTAARSGAARNGTLIAGETVAETPRAGPAVAAASATPAITAPAPHQRVVRISGPPVGVLRPRSRNGR